MDEVTREAIEGYVPHYAERIPDWTQGAELWPAHFGTTAAEVNNGDWCGDAQDQAAVTALRHLGVANEAAGIVAGHAAAAADDAGAMTAAQSMFNSAVANAEDAGINATVGGPFTVSNDLQVHDPQPPGQGLLARELAAARRDVLAFHQERITSAANAMQQLSTSIAAAADGRTQDLTETTRYPGAQAVGMGMGSGFKADPALPLPQPPMPAPSNSPQPPAWPPPGGVPASVPNPAGSLSSARPPAVIAPAPKPNPKDHDCSTREIIDDSAEVVMGGVGMAGGPELPFPANVGAVAGGVKLAYDGLEDMSHCTNANDK